MTLEGDFVARNPSLGAETNAELVSMFADTANTPGETVKNWIGSGAREANN